MKKTKTTTRRGVSPIIAVILLLLMTVAAAGAAYLWMTKLQTMMTESVTGSFLQSSKAQGTRFCIDSVWDTGVSGTPQHAIAFTLRNCGDYDVTSADFANTGVYIDNVKVTYTDGGSGAFNSYDLRTMTGTANSYCPGTTTATCCPSGVCPTKTVKVTTVFGTSDAVTYTRPSS